MDEKTEFGITPHEIPISTDGYLYHTHRIFPVRHSGFSPGHRLGAVLPGSRQQDSPLRLIAHSERRKQGARHGEAAYTLWEETQRPAGIPGDVLTRARGIGAVLDTADRIAGKRVRPFE